MISQTTHKGEIIDKATGKVIQPIYNRESYQRVKQHYESTTDLSRIGKPTLNRIESNLYLLSGKRNTTFITKVELRQYRNPPSDISKSVLVKRQLLTILLFLHKHPQLYTTQDIEKVFKVTRNQAYSRLNRLRKENKIKRIRITGDRKGSNAVYYTTNPYATDRNLQGNYLWFIKQNCRFWWKR